MSQFFYDLVQDAIDNDNRERMSAMYELRLVDMRDWCQEQVNLISVPYSFAKYVLDDLFAGDSDFPYKLWRYMQDSCEPDPDEEEEEDADE